MHPSYANSLGNIGITYETKGDYDKAFEFLNKSFDIIQSIYS
jgi:tetratricopeptide (TPR) repeat protein